MSSKVWKVGDLAKATGLTVRTLHHYDDVGLLAPSQHTESGHRLYTKADLERLQKILSLRHLGFSLDEIKGCLDKPGFASLEVVRLHLARLASEMLEQQRLAERLRGLERVLAASEEVSAAQLLDVLEGMAMIEKYYTKEQLAELERRRKDVGEQRIKEVEAEWPRLMAEARRHMDAGTDPNDPAVQALAVRWAALLAEFTGGDPGIERSLKTMYKSEPSAPAKFGMPADMLKISEYIRRSAGYTRGS